MLLGKTFNVIPEFTRGEKAGNDRDGRCLPGKVIYEDKRGRYVTMEFLIGAYTLRETFWLPEFSCNGGRYIASPPRKR